MNAKDITDSERGDSQLDMNKTPTQANIEFNITLKNGNEVENFQAKDDVGEENRKRVETATVEDVER